MKELKVAFMKRAGKLPEGLYAFKEPNSYYSAVYFRKAKGCSQKVYRAILDALHDSWGKEKL